MEPGKGKKVPKVCQELDVADQTCYRWRQKVGGMQPEMVKQLKGLEKENSRLKKLVADQALDMEILKEGARSPKCVDIWGSLIGILILLLGRCNYAVGLFGNFEPAASRFCRRFLAFRADHAAFSSS